jgi:hypothetical protein
MDRYQARGSLDALAEWPEWLLPSVMPPPVPLAPPTDFARRTAAFGEARGQLAGVLRFVMDAREGERNQRLYWAACRVREMAAERKISLAGGVALLTEAARRIGLPCREIEHTILSSGGFHE